MAPLLTDKYHKEEAIINKNEEFSESMQHKRQRLFPKEKDSQYDSPYDEALRNDSKTMAPIRRWEKRMGFVTPIRWKNVIFISAYHLITVLWFFHAIAAWRTPKWQTFIFGVIIGQLSGFGVTGGVHRYWCHRSYKAKWPLRVILMLCYSIAGQNTIYQWVRDHRVHHKFSETTADPHDANRGFFFSHVGWLMMKKHPDVIKAGRKIDMSDIINDPIVQFHTKYFYLFKICMCFLLPSMVPRLLWDETWEMSIYSQMFARYVISLNCTWAVNSFAHLWGNKPYDRNIMPVENKSVSILAMGEGWHNYHHTFPWDYKASELGVPHNTTTLLLDFFSQIGWAYDLKAASPKLIKEVIKKRGDLNKLNEH